MECGITSLSVSIFVSSHPWKWEAGIFRLLACVLSECVLKSLCSQLPWATAAFISSSKCLMRVTQLLLHCCSAQAMLFLFEELVVCLALPYLSPAKDSETSPGDILGEDTYWHSSISCLMDVSYPEDCASASAGFRIT